MATRRTSYFAHHGQLCASQPAEIIAGTGVLAVIATSYLTSSLRDSVFGRTLSGPISIWPTALLPMNLAHEMDTIQMALKTFVRCQLLLYTYNQLQMVQRTFSKSTAGFTAVFAAVSATLFSTLVWGVLQFEWSEFGDLVLFYLFWMDFSKIAHVIGSGLRTCNHFQLNLAMAGAFGRVGPPATFESVIQVLVISTGLISGLGQLEMLASLGFLAVITNYTVFMTLFPASLSMMVEATRQRPPSPPVPEKSSSPTNKSSAEPERMESVPVPSVDSSGPTQPATAKFVTSHVSHPPQGGAQIIKLLIATSFFLLQSYGHWNFSFGTSAAVEFEAPAVTQETMNIVKNQTEEGSDSSDALSVLSLLRLDQAIILALVIILSIKYVFYDSRMGAGGDEGTSSRGTPVQRVLPVVKRVTTRVKVGILEEDETGMESDGSCGAGKDLDLANISFIVGESESDSDQESLRKERVVLQSTGVQTVESCVKDLNVSGKESDAVRPLVECLRVYNSEDEGARCLTDAEVISLVDAKKIPAYQLEKAVQDEERGVAIRRKVIAKSDELTRPAFDEIPYKDYDYSKITGACCENVVGYIPVPLGVVGPLHLDGKKYTVPMATTEGCLVASTNRGCRALSGGIRSRVFGDGMTRGPVVRFPNAMRASDAAIWVHSPGNFQKLKESFDSTSRFARLEKVTCRPAGRYLFIRFVAKTGDAMGMNMISKGTEISLNTLQNYFPEMEILSLSGNFCTDKKPAAINWVEGRGKSVVAEAVVPAEIVQNILKTSTAALVELNIAKNLVGSAMAGSIGGYNAHAANIVSAIYIATGQDTAQCVGSSNCITLMEPWGPDGQDLYISCTMPSIEVGTVGGGTVLPPQSACLKMLGFQGPNLDEAGDNARGLARVVCATVLAGELSLMSALAAGHLVRSHLKHNRSSVNMDVGLRSVATSPAGFPSYVPKPPLLPRTLAATSELIPRITTSTYNDSMSRAGKDSIDFSAVEDKVTSNVPLSVQSQPLTLPITPKSLDLLSVPTECKQF